MEGSKLFGPIKIGRLSLANRIVMAPMTRNRCGVRHVPTDLMKEYYSQRATAGMIITEATSICPGGVGYPSTPGIWAREQINAWRSIVNAVHKKNGKIILQLWHVGRLSDPVYLNGALPVAPSAIPAAGTVSLLRPKKPYVTPRAMTHDDIIEVINAFYSASIHARDAEFDGIELHGANGYLLSQFMNDSSNVRSDEYGGCIENRCRLALEIVDAVTSIWDPGYVGYHISPKGDAHDPGDSDPAATYGHLVDELGRRKIGFICVRESGEGNQYSRELRARFNGSFIANENLTIGSAQRLIDANEADAAAFGRLYISNPDLLDRMKLGRPLAPWDKDTFCSEGARGYTDYPTYSDLQS